MTRLAPHFRNPASDARVTRVWAALDSKLERVERRRPVRRSVLGFAAFAAVGVSLYCAVYVGGLRRADSRGMQVLALAEGSRIEHAADEPIAVEAVSPERVELRMTRGRAVFRVARNPKRAFLTHARGYTIRVIGTEYSVELGRETLRVDVVRGEVEVRRDASTDVWRVHAGESWTSSVAAVQTQIGASATAGASAPQMQPMAAAPVVPPAIRATAHRPANGSARGAQTSNTTAPNTTPQNTTTPNTTPQIAPAAAPALPTPSEGTPTSAAAALFARAQRARVEGRPEDTVRLLGEFLQRFPDDGRAGLAAFQLGRGRQDLGDPKGALAAFDLAARSGDAFKEQIEARRVQAFEQLGELDACRTARAAFLHAFPSGSFADIVRRRCP